MHKCDFPEGANKDIKSILVVCTGNSCRSVMAEGLLKKYLLVAGRGDIRVSSAGILPANGLIPTAETVHVMKDFDVDVSGYRSKHLTAQLIKEADLILVMEEIHRQDVLNKVPDAAPKTCLLREFGVENNNKNRIALGVRDPIGRPLEDYKTCVEMIEKEIERIVKIL